MMVIEAKESFHNMLFISLKYKSIKAISLVAFRQDCKKPPTVWAIEIEMPDIVNTKVRTWIAVFPVYKSRIMAFTTTKTDIPTACMILPANNDS